MKKKREILFPFGDEMRLRLRKMKLTVLLTFLVIATFGNGFSQVTLSLHFNKANVQDVLQSIEKKTEYIFMYKDDIFHGSKAVSIDFEDAKFEEVLKSVCEQCNVDYEVRDRQIILKEKADFRVPSVMQQTQKREITGIVRDLKGLPLPGVTVLAKGTTNGTITDVGGRFRLPVAEGTKILAFSFIGMKNQEVSLGSLTQVNVTMVEAETGLEEVVVVGYGTQKRVNLTGSITTIKAADLIDTPLPNIAQSIAGRSPGVYVKTVNGQPGDKVNVSFNIRGYGNPLIVIDGAASSADDFEKLNPVDIESFSVLKDAASASIYGARAGNGVVLVTTKKGIISAPKVTFSSNYSLQFFTERPHWVNSEEEARMENLGMWNEGAPATWTTEQIQKLHDGTDPAYPNTNWWDLTVRKFAPQIQSNLSVQGGTEKVKYFVSGGYFYQEAMLRANDTKNKVYNLRSNIDIALTKKLTLNLGLMTSYQDFLGPFEEMERGTGQKHSIMTYLFRENAYSPAYGPDPTKPLASGDGNPVALSQSAVTGYRKNKELKVDAKVGFTWELPFGLQAKALWHVYNDNQLNKLVNRAGPQWAYDFTTKIYTIVGYAEPGYSLVQNYNNSIQNMDQQYTLNWTRKFGDHNLSALVGFEQSVTSNEYFQANRQKYAFPIDYLMAGPTLNETNTGDGGQGGREGVISRLNYNYKGKYLVEFDGRNDASSLFPKATRWGFFPSASVGWRISEENFIKENLPMVSNLKLRASYGNLGYDLNTTTNQFLQTYGVNGTYIYDGATSTLDNGIRAGALPNPHITWEKMTSKDIGLDFSLFGSKLEGSFDYFYRLRSDVLGTRIQSIPNVVGATLPQSNYARYDNRGMELTLNHRNKIFGIEYSIGGNVSWNREKCLYVDQSQFSNTDSYRLSNMIGQWTDNFWGYKTAGLFQTQAEINSWADIDGKRNATTKLGDVKFVDYNGDGKITTADQTIIGRGDFPKLMYGINMTLAYKGFDFSMLWQGAGLYDFNMRNAPDLTLPFYASPDNPQIEMLKNSYIPEGNPWLPANTTNAKWPQFQDGTLNRANPSYAWNSQLWLINGSYIRLKNIELGYTLPKSLISKYGIDKCKFYVSGFDLLTFSALKNIDPEIDTHAVSTFGDYYPPVGTYNVGVKIEF